MKKTTLKDRFNKTAGFVKKTLGPLHNIIEGKVAPVAERVKKSPYTKVMELSVIGVKSATLARMAWIGMTFMGGFCVKGCLTENASLEKKAKEAYVLVEDETGRMQPVPTHSVVQSMEKRLRAAESRLESLERRALEAGKGAER